MIPRTTRRGRFGTAALLACFAAACGRPAPVPEPAPTPDPCILPTGEPGEPRELLVALVRRDDTSLVAPRQPRPLIRLDCTGTARPGAADSWTADSTRRTWTFVLARSALNLTAASAAAEWQTRATAASTLRQGGVVGVVPLDERRLAVTLRSSHDSVPPLFADPSLALVTDSLPALGTTFRLRSAGADPRDALDGGADVLPTDDPALLEYARARTDVVVHPLPWSRTYLLLIPPGQDGFEGLIPADTASFRAGLARDAVRVAARAAEAPFWWNEAGACADTESVVGSADSGLRVTTATRPDPVGRALAERLVALSSRPMRVLGGLDPLAPVPALRSAGGLAYILAVPRISLVPCREIADWPTGATVVPLIETRRSVAARRGIPPLTVEYDGRLRAVETP
jgi:hypothetical protein